MPARKTDVKETDKKPVVKAETAEKEDIKKETVPTKKGASEEKAEPTAKAAGKEAAAAKAPARKEKATAKKTGKAAEKKTATEKKTAAKKDEAEKTPAKPGRKLAGKKADNFVPEFHLQYGAFETTNSDIVNRIKEKYVSEGHRAGNIKNLQIYVKPEEGKAYYVINEKPANEWVDLF